MKNSDVMSNMDLETFCPTSREEWRSWLQENHDSKQSIWLIYCKVKTGMSSLRWSDAVDEALCFGWIDSTRRPLDAEKFMQLFSRRNPKSIWSKINKEKVERLIAEGLMTAAGYKSIEVAQQNGSWTIMDLVEDLKMPLELEKAFKAKPEAEAYFHGLSKSSKKIILQWIVLAKRPETRQNRIKEVVDLASQNLKPKQFR